MRSNRAVEPEFWGILSNTIKVLAIYVTQGYDLLKEDQSRLCSTMYFYNQQLSPTMTIVHINRNSVIHLGKEILIVYEQTRLV